VDEAGRLGIWKIFHDEQTLLASQPFTPLTKVWYAMEVTVQGSVILEQFQLPGGKISLPRWKNS